MDDFEPWDSAIRSRMNRTNGFEGCINQEQCGHHGFYSQEYSKEGLCDECECRQFPDRFVACPFCRDHMRKLSYAELSTCYSLCYHSLGNYIAERFQMVSINGLKGSSWCVSDYLKSTQTSISRKFMKGLKGPRKTNKGVMIYRGVHHLDNSIIRHIWSTDLQPEESDLRYAVDSPDNGFIGYICIKYKLFGPETGEETSYQITNDDITFDEYL